MFKVGDVITVSQELVDYQKRVGTNSGCPQVGDIYKIGYIDQNVVELVENVSKFKSCFQIPLSVAISLIS